MGSLEGRIAVVTGAGAGLGREHALLLAAEGAHVVVNDPGHTTDGTGADASVAQAVVEEIEAGGGVAVANTDSVADWEGARNIVDTAIQTFGDLHIVINNAGNIRDRTLVNMTDEEFDSVIAVHLRGTFAVSRWAAAFWREQSKAGAAVDRAIVNTSSGAGLHGNDGQTNYAAAKAGIAAMTLVAASELKRYGARANAIAPFGRTRMALQTPGLAETVTEFAERAGWDVFAPANVSPLVAYLSTADCPFTGQVFSVYGGAVSIYQGWSMADEIRNDGPWTVEELAVAMDKLPRSVEVKDQVSALYAEIESGGRQA